MQKVLIPLPVPKYLKKILEFKYGENYSAKDSSLFGLVILQSLQRKSERNYHYKRENTHDGYFFIRIGIDKANHKGFKFNQRAAYQIAKALHRNIREELYIETIRNKESYSIEYQTTLLNFLDLYDITEEELSYESLRKDFNRFLFKAKKSGLFQKIIEKLNV